MRRPVLCHHSSAGLGLSSRALAGPCEALGSSPVLEKKYNESPEGSGFHQRSDAIAIRDAETLAHSPSGEGSGRWDPSWDSASTSSGPPGDALPPSSCPLPSSVSLSIPVVSLSRHQAHQALVTWRTLRTPEWGLPVILENVAARWPCPQSPGGTTGWRSRAQTLVLRPWAGHPISRVQFPPEKAPGRGREWEPWPHSPPLPRESRVTVSGSRSLPGPKGFHEQNLQAQRRRGALGLQRGRSVLASSPV